jgi:DNA repair exonuclease SbcCD ATPase subunit
MSEKERPAAPEEGGPEVDRIRDIIFGPQMRDYQQRFQTVQRDLDRLQQEINQLSEQLAEQDRSQGERLQALRKEVRRADDDLRNELRETAKELGTAKVDRVILGDLFVELGTRLKTGGAFSDLLRGLTETDQSQDREGS